MKNIRKIIAVIVCLTMIIANFSLSFAENVENVQTTNKDYAGHWAESTIQKWIDEGKIKGYQDGSFKPDNKITRAEFVQLVNNSLVDYESQDATPFTDVPSGEWYAKAINTAYATEYIKGISQTKFAPNSNVSREQAAAIMSRIQYLADNNAATQTFADSSQISSWAIGQVGAASDAGFVKGYNNKFNPLNNLTRAEAVTMLNNVLQNGKNEVIYKAGTELKDTTINGDLIIAKTVGEGDVHVTNVEVKGKIKVYGGGANSVYFNNVKVQSIEVDKEKVRLVLEGGSVVQELAIGSETIVENQDGTIAKVIIDSENKVTLTGEFSGVTVLSSANIILDKAVIETLTVEKPISIIGTGTIETLNANADGIQYDSTTKIEQSVLGTGVTDKPAIISAGGGGGGGGGSLPPAASYAINISAEIINESDLSNSHDFSFTTNEYSQNDTLAAFLKSEISDILYDDSRIETINSILNLVNTRLQNLTVNGVTLFSESGWDKATAYLAGTSYEEGLADPDMQAAILDGIDLNDLKNLDLQFEQNMPFIDEDLAQINLNLENYPFNEKVISYNGETVIYSIAFNGEELTDNQQVAEFILTNLVFSTGFVNDLFEEFGDVITITGTSDNYVSTIIIQKVQLP